MQKCAYANIRRRVSLWQVWNCGCWCCTCASSLFSCPHRRGCFPLPGISLCTLSFPLLLHILSIVYPCHFPVALLITCEHLYKLRTTPYCHCGQFPKVSQNPIPTTASPGESDLNSLLVLLPKLLTSPRATSTLCCGFLSLLKPTLWQICLIYPRPRCLSAPMLPFSSALHPTPNLHDYWFPSPLYCFQQACLFLSLLLPNTSPLLALLSCSELKPRSQAQRSRSCRHISGYTQAFVALPSSMHSKPQHRISLLPGS